MGIQASWVLPGPDHPMVRLSGDFQPSFPALPSVHQDGVRLQTGGSLRAPALDLVDTAKEVGKLDDLVARLDKLTRASDDETASSDAVVESSWPWSTSPEAKTLKRPG